MGAFFKQFAMLLLPTLGTIISALMMRLIKAQADKVGLELTAKQIELLTRLVELAVLRVEEMARRTDMTGDQKAAAAVAIIRAQRPDMTEKEAKNLIDAVLPKVRAQLSQFPAGA